MDDDDDRPRPFPRVEGDDGEPIETIELVVEHVHESHRLMFELLAATGLRRSELLVLDGRHLALDGAWPHVKVRQRVRRRRGEGLVIGPLKSRYSKRDVPIPRALADRLRALEPRPTTSCSARPPARSSIRTIWPRECLRQRARQPASSGQASIRFATPSRRACSRRAECRAGAALARSPLGQLHSRHLRPPARERSWRAATGCKYSVSRCCVA
jgi:integrase